MGRKKRRKRKTPASAETSVEELPPTASKPSRNRARCPVCGGSKARRLSGAGSRYARCKGCGTLFLGERPSPDETAKRREDRFRRAFALPLHEYRRRSREQALKAMRGYFEVTAGKPAALNALAALTYHSVSR